LGASVYFYFLILLATSDPACGSLTPMQVTISPLMAGTRNSFFSLSLPNLSKFTDTRAQTNIRQLPIDIYYMPIDADHVVYRCAMTCAFDFA